MEKVVAATETGNAAQIDFLAKITARIDSIAASDRLTKAELSPLSREILEYIVLNASPDVATVNRLLSVLSAANKKMCLLFFKEHIPHKVEGFVFGGRMKGDKRLEEYANKAKDFLANPDNDVFTWFTANVKMEVKPKSFEERIKSLIQKALEGDDKHPAITPEDVLASVVSGGVSIDTMFKAIESLGKTAAADATTVAAAAPPAAKRRHPAANTAKEQAEVKAA